MAPESQYARVAGYAFEQVDSILGRLGKPLGIKTYKPFHSSGEDFLASYLGMVGIPTDIVPEFPAAEKTILLTEAAKFDPAIVDKDQAAAAGGQERRHHFRDC